MARQATARFTDGLSGWLRSALPGVAPVAMQQGRHAVHSIAATLQGKPRAAFRSGFLGKVSPVHFFWGSFDLAVTRFSGRKAPLHPGGVPGLPDAVAREVVAEALLGAPRRRHPSHAR